MFEATMDKGVEDKHEDIIYVLKALYLRPPWIRESRTNTKKKKKKNKKIDVLKDVMFEVLE